jgi:hypothetical protein
MVTGSIGRAAQSCYGCVPVAEKSPSSAQSGRRERVARSARFIEEGLVNRSSANLSANSEIVCSIESKSCWTIAPRPVRISTETWRVTTLLPRQSMRPLLQCTRDAFSDIAADEGLSKHVYDPCSLRSFAHLRATVAAHEHDRSIGSQPQDLKRKLGSRQVGHRLIAEHQIEPGGFRAKGLQRGKARVEPDRFVAKLGQRLFRERNQGRLVVYDHDDLAVASR